VQRASQPRLLLPELLFFKGLATIFAEKMANKASFIAYILTSRKNWFFFFGIQIYILIYFNLKTPNKYHYNINKPIHQPKNNKKNTKSIWLKLFPLKPYLLSRTLKFKTTFMEFFSLNETY